MAYDLDLPEEFIIFDMEWTAWEGSYERGWDRPDEHREIYDIGAVRVVGENFEVTDTYRQLVTLELTDKLPEYSTKLTGITQADIDKEGIAFKDMVPAFKKFAGDLEIYQWGHDGDILAENCELKNVDVPFRPDQFHNLREDFKAHGIPADDYHSSTIVEYFGKQNQHTAHQSLDDALNQVEALKLLKAKLKSGE